MRRHEKELLQDIMDDLIERLIGTIVERKQVTLPAPIRVTPQRIDRT